MRNGVILTFPLTTFYIATSQHHLHITYNITELIRYARTCVAFDLYLSPCKQLTDKLMLLEFLQQCLMSAFLQVLSPLH
jgi:hypothetical protein